jgi:hypothetical protein
MNTKMAVSSPLSSRQTVAALLTLTAVTGLVDAVSYLRLGRVFVANMTGNVVFLGFSVDPRSGLSAAASIIAIAGFILGALVGGRAAHALAAAGPVAGWPPRSPEKRSSSAWSRCSPGPACCPSPGAAGSPPSPSWPRPSACRTAPSGTSALPT